MPRLTFAQRTALQSAPGSPFLDNGRFRVVVNGTEVGTSRTTAAR